MNPVENSLNQQVIIKSNSATIQPAVINQSTQNLANNTFQLIGYPVFSCPGNQK